MLHIAVVLQRFESFLILSIVPLSNAFFFNVCFVCVECFLALPLVNQDHTHTRYLFFIINLQCVVLSTIITVAQPELMEWCCCLGCEAQLQKLWVWGCEWHLSKPPGPATLMKPSRLPNSIMSERRELSVRPTQLRGLFSERPSSINLPWKFGPWCVQGVFQLFIYYGIEAGEALADVINPVIFAFLSRFEIPSICWACGMRRAADVTS